MKTKTRSGLNQIPAVALGSAPASGAAGRALATRLGGRKPNTIRFVFVRSSSARGRAERQPGRLCSPFSSAWFRLNQILCSGVLAASVLLAGRAAAGQPILQDPPMMSTKPAAQLEAESKSDLAVFTPMADNRDSSLPQPLKIGKVVLRPHVNYQITFGTGLVASPSNTVDSTIQTISPGFAIDFGRHWTLDYTPSIRIYSSKAFHDSVDHSASLRGAFSYEDWLFGVTQGFSKSDSLAVETGMQSQQENYNTELTATHQLSEKYSFDLNLSQVINDVATVGTNFLSGGNQTSRTWSTLDWLNYQAGKRASLGIGAGLGYVDSDIGAGQLFEQLQGRVQWRITEKVSLSLNGGLEDRQILASGSSDSLNPIFGLSLRYAPFEHTQITLSANRTISSSDYYLSSQTTENTGVSLNVSQRLLEKFYLSGGVSYGHTDYKNSAGAFSTARSDDNYNFTASLSRAFLKRGNISVTYSYGDNRSTQTDFFGVEHHDFTYRSSQIGISAGFAY